MSNGQQRPFDWREKTIDLARELDRAHSVVEALGVALDHSGSPSAAHMAKSAHEAVKSVAEAVNTMHTEQPPTESLTEPDALGSTLVIGGSGAATIALDVMVDTMVSLAGAHDESDTDFLIGAYLDAGNAFEVGAAVVHAAPSRDGTAMRDLLRAFETEGAVALRRRVTRARPRVRAISERVAG